MSTIKKAAIYISLFFFSAIFVFVTGLADGIKIENGRDLQSAFPHEAGFPIPFVTLDYPTIDPPLPYYYNGFCCARFYNWTDYWLSVLLIFSILSILISVFWTLKKRGLKND